MAKRKRSSSSREVDDDDDRDHDVRNRRNDPIHDTNDEDHTAMDDDEEEEDFAPQIVLTGFLHGENNEMYLHDGKFVYSAARDANENLVKVGTWDNVKKRAEITVTKTEGHDDNLNATTTTPSTSKRKTIHYNFELKPDVADHAETPLQAVRDIVPALNALAAALNVHPPSKLKIYDPYYCTGKIKRNFAELGFPNVYNENVDFYKAQRNDLPPFDVLVTNPPYSGDHIEKLLDFTAKTSKPCFLLMPNYVGTKPYYLRSRFRMNANPLFITPRKGRYLYQAPDLEVGEEEEEERGDKLKRRTSPFHSFWYVDPKQFRAWILRKAGTTNERNDDVGLISPTYNDIPLKFLDSSDERRKKARDRERRNKRGKSSNFNNPKSHSTSNNGSPGSNNKPAFSSSHAFSDKKRRKTEEIDD